jgi:hypothetical protein
MNPRILAAALGLALVIGGLGALAGLDSCRKHQGEAGEHNAAVASGAANVHQSQAQAQDPIIADLQAQHEKDAADLGRLNAERDALLRKLASRPKPHVDSVGDNSSPTDPVGADDSALEAAEAVIAKDAEVIESQEILIKNQSEQILVITKKSDEWEATAKARERQALAQEAATKAWRDAVTTSRWRGRIEGFAAGVALGYVGGRR